MLGVGCRTDQDSLAASLSQSVVQSYLEGVKTGMWQLARALEAVHGAREALGQARGLLRGMAEAAQTLEPLRERVAQHKQLQALSQLLPRLRAGECAGALGLSPPTISQQMPITSRGRGISVRLHGGTRQEPPRQPLRLQMTNEVACKTAHSGVPKMGCLSQD